MEALGALGINLGYLLTQFFAFLILLLLMKGWAYGPILKLLEERKARIAKGLEDARQAAIARDNADAEAKKILDAARSEAAKIRAEAAVQAEETAANITAQAHNEAKAIMASAAEDVEAERNRILSDLRGQVAAIAIAAANKIVREALDEQRQHQLVAEFFAKVPSGISEVSGDHAVVFSAVPLTEEEKQNLRNTIRADTIDFKVDPTILGGLIVRIGDHVIDNSVVGQMNALRESLR